MFIFDVVVATRGAKFVRFKQYFGVGAPVWWFEFVRREFDEQAEWITEVDRAHKTAIFLTAVFDACFV